MSEIYKPGRAVFAVLGTAIFLLLAPGTIAGLVPWWISRWSLRAPFLGFTPIRVVGVVFIAASISVLLESFARFALQGIGTPAPVFPTRHLVVKGFYRYVRNPMYVAVVSLILGQALLLGDIRLLWPMRYFAGWPCICLFLPTRSRLCGNLLGLSTKFFARTSRGGYLVPAHGAKARNNQGRGRRGSACWSPSARLCAASLAACTCLE